MYIKGLGQSRALKKGLTLIIPSVSKKKRYRIPRVKALLNMYLKV